MDNLFSTIKALLHVAYVLSFGILLLNIGYIYYFIKKKNDPELHIEKLFTNKIFIIVIETIFIIGIFASPPIFSKFENTNIGSFFEKEHYQEQYYVYIRNNTDNSKAYKVKADIVKGDYGYESYTDEGEETFISQGNGYFIKKIYWDNGGYLTFIKEKGYAIDSTANARIYPGKETQCTDYKEDNYYITLTSEKVK